MTAVIQAEAGKNAFSLVQIISARQARTHDDAHQTNKKEFFSIFSHTILSSRETKENNELKIMDSFPFQQQQQQQQQSIPLPSIFDSTGSLRSLLLRRDSSCRKKKQASIPFPLTPVVTYYPSSPPLEYPRETAVAPSTTTTTMTPMMYHYSFARKRRSLCGSMTSISSIPEDSGNDDEEEDSSSLEA